MSKPSRTFGWLQLALAPDTGWGVASFVFMLVCFGLGAVLIFINFLALRQAVTPAPLLGRMTSTMRWLILIPAGPGASAEEVSIARQTAKVVEEALAKLPPAQREAFVLIRYEGMSVADTAKILGATENAVKLRAFHAYEALRAALGIEKEKPKR